MNVVPSGIPLSFEYSAYDESASLAVAMKVYDISSIGSPVLVSTTAMAHLFGGTYVGNMTPAAGKQYLIHKAVYTDGSFDTLDPMRSPGSETFLASSTAGGSLTPTDIMNIKDAVWDEPQAGHAVAGTFGANLDVPVSSRGSDAELSDMATKIDNINANTVPAVIAQDVWNAARSGFQVSGSFGESNQGNVTPARAALIDNLSRLDVAVSTRGTQTTANDTLSVVNAIRGDYTAGRAANLDRLDVAVSTRATGASVAALPTAAQIITGVWDEPMASHLTAGSTGFYLADPSGVDLSPGAIVAVADAVWDEAAAGHGTAGTFGSRLDAGVTSRASDADIQAIKGSGFISADSLHAIRVKVDSLPTSAGDATAANQATILAAVGTRASASMLGSVQSAVAAIPTNPLLTNDGRLANLDAAVSSRAPTARLDQAMGAGFTAGDDLHSIKAAVGASVDLSPVLAGLADIKGAGFSSASDGLAANADAVAAATSAATAAANAATAAQAAVASKASQSSVNAIAVSVAAIPTNPALATDPRLAHLDANVSSRADDVTLGQLLGPSFNPATDSARAIRVLLSALAPGDATIAKQMDILSAISTLATATGLNGVAAAVAQIPINPVLANDIRLNRIDVAISTRATAASIAAIQGPSFDQNNDNLHEIRNSVPPAFDTTAVIVELQKIEGTGFEQGQDDLKHANDRAKTERAQIYADTQSLLSVGEPF